MTTSRTTMRSAARIVRPGRAFTLVELLVVLGIIAIATSVVVPNVGSAMRGMRVRQAALTLATHVRYAQMLCVEKERPARVVLDSDGRFYRVELASNLLSVEFGPAPGAAGDVGLPEGVEFGRIAFPAAPDGLKDVLVFDPVGAWSSGSVELTEGERTYRVAVGEGFGEVEAISREKGLEHERGYDPVSADAWE